MNIVNRGLDNSGKSTIVQRLLHNDLSQVAPTFGFSIHTLHRSNLTINLWDIGGQKAIRAFWRNYFEQTDGIIWVVDSTAPERLEVCRQELFSVIQEHRLQSASLLIMANKQDIPNSTSTELIKKALNWEALLKRSNCHMVHCSAFTGLNVEEGLDWLISDISTRLSYK